MIKEITLERFKKFENTKIFLNPFSVLMGENSSGKTTVLQAMNFALLSLFNYDLVQTDHNSESKARQKGVGLTTLPGIALSDFRELYYAKISRSSRMKKTIGANIHLTDNKSNVYKLQVTSMFGTFNVKCFSDKSDLSNTPNLQNKPPLYISGFVGLTSVEERVFPVALLDRLRSGNVSSIIRNLVFDTKKNTPKRYKLLKNRLSKDFNFYLDEVVFDESKDLYVSAQYSEVCQEKYLSFDFNNSGSGFMQILQILAPIYRFCPDESEIVLLDEPDAHLHPNLQTTLANSLRKIQAELNIQIIISTHSTSIIRATPPNNVVPINAKIEDCKPLSDRSDIEESIRENIDSYNLAKSVISGKLIFFEDSNISLWEKIDEILSTKVFTGASTPPIIKGRGKTDRVPFHMKKIIDEVLNEKIEVFYIRDRDGLNDEWVNKLSNYASEKEINLKILNFFELENYLLNPKLIFETIKKKNTNNKISIEQITENIKTYLKNTISLSKYRYDHCLENELYQSAILMNLDEYRNPQQIASIVKTWHIELESIDSLEDLQKYGAGKETLKQLFDWLNSNGININKDDLISNINKSLINSELIDILHELRSRDLSIEPFQYDAFNVEDETDDIDEQIQMILDFAE